MADADAAYDVLRDDLRPGDVVLVKSSNSRACATSATASPGSRPPRDRPAHRAAPSRSSSRSSLTPLFIRLFNRLGWGQFIRDDGPQSHHTKRGTPTMGGIVFILGAVLGYFVGHLVCETPLTTRRGCSSSFLMVGLGARRLHRRLPEDPQAAQPRARRLGEDRRPGRSSRRSSRCSRSTSPTRTACTPASTFISGVRDIPWLNLAAFGAVDRRHPVRALGEHHHRVAPRTASTSPTASTASPPAPSIFADRGLHLHRLLAVQPVVLQRRRSTPTCSYRCYDVRDPLDLAVIAAASRAPSSASSGGTPRPPRSSWATPARSASAARSPPSRSSAAPSCCSCSSAACSSSSPAR